MKPQMNLALRTIAVVFAIGLAQPLFAQQAAKTDIGTLDKESAEQAFKQRARFVLHRQRGCGSAPGKRAESEILRWTLGGRYRRGMEREPQGDRVAVEPGARCISGTI